MVAVKIIEYMQEQGQRGPLEGLLSEQVQHPNVVSSSSTLGCLGSGRGGLGCWRSCSASSICCLS
jgi:hypothetical protein